MRRIKFQLRRKLKKRLLADKLLLNDIWKSVKIITKQQKTKKKYNYDNNKWNTYAYANANKHTNPKNVFINKY